MQKNRVKALYQDWASLKQVTGFAAFSGNVSQSSARVIIIMAIFFLNLNKCLISYLDNIFLLVPGLQSTTLQNFHKYLIISLWAILLTYRQTDITSLAEVNRTDMYLATAADTKVNVHTWELMIKSLHDVTLSTQRLPWLHHWHLHGDDVQLLHLAHTCTYTFK